MVESSLVWSLSSKMLRNCPTACYHRLITRCDCGPLTWPLSVYLSALFCRLAQLCGCALQRETYIRTNSHHQTSSGPFTVGLARQSHTANSRSVTPTGGPDTSRSHVLPFFQIVKSTIHLQRHTLVTNNHERQGDEVLAGWYLHPRGW